MIFLSKAVRQQFLASCENIAQGTLYLRTPEGESLVFGEGDPVADLQINDWATVTACASRGDIGLGEAYVEGLWDTSSIEQLSIVALLNYQSFEGFSRAGFWHRLRYHIADRFLRSNSVRGASRNIRSHYDVGNEFYQLWLDRSMTYSSALFERDAEGKAEPDLHAAQQRKYDRIVGQLSDGERVLEVGCGWGGFAERAADLGLDVTGITISPSQKAYADARLDGRAKIELSDYRAPRGQYDNIVSIEMIEAVGERYWPVYFGMLARNLKEGGKAVVQAITTKDENFADYRKHSDFIRRYTFPGGMLLCDNEIEKAAHNAGLRVKESFGFGRDYAETCRRWSAEIATRDKDIRKLGYDSRFLRSWQYYLGICAASFETDQTDVVQVVLEHA